MKVSASERTPLPLGADLRRLVAGNCAPWARAPKTLQLSVAWHRLQGETAAKTLRGPIPTIESEPDIEHEFEFSIHFCYRLEYLLRA